jgi:hypothetical protein
MIIEQSIVAISASHSENESRQKNRPFKHDYFDSPYLVAGSLCVHMMLNVMKIEAHRPGMA